MYVFSREFGTLPLVAQVEAGGTRAVLRVTLEQERAFRLARHGLLDRSFAHASIDRLAASLVGLHAARQVSPWVAIRTRMRAFQPSDLRRLLLDDRKLIKVRCMRQTLHILPLELAATAHHATLRQRLGPCRARLRRMGRSERALNRMVASVRDRLDGVPVPYRDLEIVAGIGSRSDIELVRLAIKWMWETGEIAHVDLSPSLHHEHRAFARTDALYPELGLYPEAPDLEIACDDLVRAHIRAFGPVSVGDTAWWSGLGAGAVRRAVERRPGEFVSVRVDGLAGDLLMSLEFADELLDTAPLDPGHVVLLAYEDPALKGYFTSRHRYVDEADYESLFNAIGEARASVMVGGRAIGSWSFDRRLRRIVYRTRRRVPAAARAAIESQLCDMEAFLRAEPMISAGASTSTAC